MSGYSAQVVERFWRKVSKVGPFHPVLRTRCWEWQASCNNKGYGQLRISERREYAHRISWRLAHGECHGLFVLHKCDNPKCVRPGHLFLGSQYENLRDMTAKGRRRGGASLGEKNVNARLTVDSVRRIKRALQRGESLRKLARKHGVAHSQISSIKLNKTWRQVNA